MIFRIRSRARRAETVAVLVSGLMLLWGSPAAAAEGELLEGFEEKVTKLTLDNGLRILVIERHQAPVVSFHTYADVGSVDEPIGATGIAHMFEHMAFKGTTGIGSRNIEKEKEAIRRVDDIYQRLKAERAKRHRADPERVERLERKFEEARQQAEALSESEAFERILRREGVTGLNAYTSADATGYLYSLPANKLELFFAMESARFLHPVLREFYTERDVVLEERRQRVGSSPIGRLVEEWLAAAFRAHPYGQPTIGHESDLRALSRPQARTFFDRYYTAPNLVVGMAGDVDPEEARRLGETYFEGLPDDPPPLPVTTEEPEARGERRVTLVEPTQPYVLLGWHRPDLFHEDDAVFTVLADILARGRTSRFHQALVETEQALQADAFAAFPGNKYPGLFGVLGVPSKGVSPEELESRILEELERLRSEPVSEAALERARIRARADLIDSLDSNSGLARQLSTYEALTGDWRDAFRRLEEIEAVTAEDIRRVAEETFRPANRTVAVIQRESPETEEAAND